MSKSFTRFSIPKSLPRQPGALAAKGRKAGYMKHRNAGRGGSRNLQADYLDEADDLTLDIEGNDWEDVA